MNKYQEALNYLDWHCNVEHKEQQDSLQELIDKETPMKPKTYFSGHACRKCDNYIYIGSSTINNYCDICGQRQDWSVEE